MIVKPLLDLLMLQNLKAVKYLEKKAVTDFANCQPTLD